jgi:hypothetical protein
LYFELYEEDKFLAKMCFKTYAYSQKFVYFPVAQNTTQFLRKFRIIIQDMYMYSCNKFYNFLKHINIIFKYFKNQEHWCSGAPNLLSFFILSVSSMN